MPTDELNSEAMAGCNSWERLGPKGGRVDHAKKPRRQDGSDLDWPISLWSTYKKRWNITMLFIGKSIF